MSDSSFIKSVAKKLKCIRYKGGFCLDCGLDLELQPWLAHFHHRDPQDKRLGIMAALGSDYGLASVKDELEKCDLLCGHCHSSKHFSVEKFQAHRARISKMADGLTFDEYFVSDEDISRIETLAEGGSSMKEIAAATSLSLPTIRKYVPPLCFGNDKTRKITDEELEAEVGRGLALRHIAEKYRLGYKTVWKRWRKINGGSSSIAC